jgi:hypothetical protein
MREVIGGAAREGPASFRLPIAALKAMTRPERVCLALTAWSTAACARRDDRYVAAYAKVQQRVAELIGAERRGIAALRAVIRVNCYLAEAHEISARERREASAEGIEAATAAVRRILAVWGLRY